MEDLSINSGRNNVLLPVQIAEKSNGKKLNGVTNRNNESSNNESNRTENVNIDLKSTVKQVKEIAKNFSTKLTFSVDTRSNESIIYVTEKETGKVIRQIPPEEIQKMSERVNKMVGSLFSGRA